MNRMTGIIVMTSGVVIFIVGLLLFTTSKTTTSPLQLAAISITDNITNTELINTENEQDIAFSDLELENAIQMAIADGVLTANEKRIIEQIAIKKGLDHIAVIKDVEQQVADIEEAETQLVDCDKRQGDEFEKFIVQKFNKKQFHIKEWAGDKFINGIYAETTLQPDLLIETEIKEGSTEFWVECKWRKSLVNGGLEFATEKQFERYKNYEKERNIPVFIAIGIGGNGKSPEKLFVIPLRKLTSNFIPPSKLKRYTRSLKEDLYYNVKDRYINSFGYEKGKS